MLKLSHINKSYPDFSLKNIQIDVERGDYFVLLGKSGSGKSMLLEIIAGIQKQDSGLIMLNNKDISTTRIQERNCILVYQDTALFPHMSVYDNIAFTLRNHKIAKREHKYHIAEMSAFVSIEHLLKRMPANLSGGEAQRVALARALVVRPDVLLLDEPLSSLDVQLRGGMQSLLHKINLAGQTIIHVTHDIEETLSLSTKVAVIENGEIIQSGPTVEVFSNPRSEFVAGLSGMKNFFRATLSREISDDGLRLIHPSDTEIKIRVLTDAMPGEGYLNFSSKDVFLSVEKTKTSAVNNFKGTVADIVPRGNGMEILVDIGLKITVLISKTSLGELDIRLGKSVWIGFKASACKFISKE
jgi:molybdate/tungstate transport system ATP-binding protein